MKTDVLNILTAALLFLILQGCSDSSGDNNPSGPDGGNPPQWTTETITEPGMAPAIVLDSIDDPHVSFLDDGYVKYASRTTGSWNIETVGKVSNAGGTYANGGISAIAVDAGGNPHITYYDYGNVCFQHAIKNGSGWDIVPVSLPNDPRMSYDSPFIPWAESSVVVDKTSGTVHVAIQMLGGLSGYVLGYWSSGMTTAMIVDDSGTNMGYHNSIALDNNGWPAISYEDRGNHELKYAQWNGAGFDVETIATMPDVYWRDHLTSLGIDNSNNAHITFYGQGGYKYAVQDGDTWSITEIPYDSSYPALSLSLDSSDDPQITFISIDFGNSYRLKHARLNNSDWVYDNIEDDINNCAVATGIDGKIVIVYETYDNVLKYSFNK